MLGAGGVGGLVAGALARAGAEVVIILRPPTLARYPGRLRVESAVLGEFEVEVAAVSRLDRPVDVLWVAVKATQLETALKAAPPASAAGAVVVPLLNGIDHVARLRRVYGEVVIPAAVRVESERVATARIVQSSPFVTLTLAPPAGLRDRALDLADEVRAAGLDCELGEDEGQVLWGKLAMLAPLALATSAAQRPLEGVRADPELRALMLGCAREVCAVAAAEGVGLDPERSLGLLLEMPGEMRSSMQKDLAAGRPTELDAIAGPILRRGAEHGLSTPATAELAARVARRERAGLGRRCL